MLLTAFYVQAENLYRNQHTESELKSTLWHKACPGDVHNTEGDEIYLLPGTARIDWQGLYSI